jgi:two-component system, NarL family, response regulator DesR
LRAVIRVLLVEDMLLIRGALIALLENENDIEVVGDIGWDHRLIPLAIKLRADVAVIDMDPMVSQLFPTLAELRAKAQRCAVLILADPRKPFAVPRGSHVGSLSFLVKDAPPGLLPETIRKLAGGQQVIDPQIAVSVLVGTESVLTSRELEVLELAAGGASVPEIAHRLNLSRGTIRNYLSAATAKTGARNRIDAIRIARQAGWLR